MPPHKYVGRPGCHCLICRRSNAMTSQVRIPLPQPQPIYAIELTPTLPDNDRSTED